MERFGGGRMGCASSCGRERAFYWAVCYRHRGYNNTGLAFGIHIILLGVVALGLLIVWGRMLEWSYRTRAGAERAARWQAFAKWLKELHEINPAEAKAQLEAYLPYAIAFGIEKEFMARWLAIAPDTPPPSWYRSTSSYGSMRSTSSTSDRFSWGSMENTGLRVEEGEATRWTLWRILSRGV
jgi:hypothetical protein